MADLPEVGVGHRGADVPGAVEDLEDPLPFQRQAGPAHRPQELDHLGDVGEVEGQAAARLEGGDEAGDDLPGLHQVEDGGVESVFGELGLGQVAGEKPHVPGPEGLHVGAGPLQEGRPPLVAPDLAFSSHRPRQEEGQPARPRARLQHPHPRGQVEEEEQGGGVLGVGDGGPPAHEEHVLLQAGGEDPKGLPLVGDHPAAGAGGDDSGVIDHPAVVGKPPPLPEAEQVLAALGVLKQRPVAVGHFLAWAFRAAAMAA